VVCVPQSRPLLLLRSNWVGLCFELRSQECLIQIPQEIHIQRHMYSLRANNDQYCTEFPLGISVPDEVQNGTRCKFGSVGQGGLIVKKLRPPYFMNIFLLPSRITPSFLGAEIIWCLYLSAHGAYSFNDQLSLRWP
jgi:hypothetical protein